MFRRIRKNRRGFSLVEALLVVAIITILLGLAIPNVIAYSRQMKLTSLDDSAHSIFMAAQNKLMSIKNAGNDLEEFFGLEDGDKIPAAKKNTAEGAALAAEVTEGSSDIYAVKAKDNYRLVPDLSIDEELKNGNFVVEIDPRTGAVYAVWFWEDYPFAYSTQAYSAARPERSQRLESNTMVGYYGGSQISRPEIKQTPEPDIKVINAEELLLKINVPGEGLTDEDVLVTINFIDKEDNYHEVVSAAALYHDNAAGGTGDYRVTLALDTLNPDTVLYANGDFKTKEKWGRRFQDWKDDKGEPVITPGENFGIEMRVWVEGDGFTPQYVYLPSVNGLFAEADGDTVKIAYGRHLQNLNRAIANSSGVSENVKYAVQTGNISFTATEGGKEPDDVYYWEKTYGQKEKPFVPIENGYLTSYSGGGYTISDLYAVNGYNDAGLFKTMKGELKNICLVDPTIEGSGNVGALAGTASSLSVEGCRVYLTSADENSPSLKGTTVGGLIGVCGETSAKAGGAQVSFDRSFACVVENGTTVGGLVGNGANAVEIKNSYAAGYLNGDTAGGLIGMISATGSAELSDSYAAGVIAQTKLAGGLVASGKPTAISCYSAVRYSKTVVEQSKETIYGTFDGDTANEYVSQMGLKYTGGGRPVTSFELYVTGGYIAKENEKGATSAYKLLPETQHEYGLSEQYPYKMIVAGGGVLPHYGDWLEETEAYLVYYEHYDDSTYGLYASHERLKVNTLKVSNFNDNLDKRSYVIDDGYALFVLSTFDEKILSLDVTIGGGKTTLSYAEFKNVEFCGEKVKCTMYLIQEPSITIKGDWDGYDKDKGLLTQPIKHYYTTVKYEIAYTDKFGTTYTNPYSSKTYYFNPHFACEVFETEPDKTAYTDPTDKKPIYMPQIKAGAEGAVSTAEDGSAVRTVEYTATEGDVVIRTARQLSNLHCYTNTASGIGGFFGIAGVQGSNIHQLLDVDFEKYVADRLSGGGKYDDRIYPATLYKGLYDGHEHVIRNIFLSRQAITAQNAIGLFAKVAAATLQNIFIVNPTTFVGENDFGDYMGGLVGYCDNATITNCGIYDEVKNQDNPHETYKPYYRHKAVNSNDYNVVLGGLIGYAVGSTISESFAAVKVFGHTAGGFIGEMAAGTTVKDCYSGGYTQHADYYEKTYSLGSIKGYPAYSEQGGTDTINVGGGGTSVVDGKTYYGVIGGFVGIVDEDARFDGICYTTCSVRGSDVNWMGLFAGKTPASFAHGTLYSTGVAISEATSTKKTIGGYEYSFYPEQTGIRSESYLTKKENFGSLAHKVTQVFPYNGDLKTKTYPYPSNLTKHYGDWVPPDSSAVTADAVTEALEGVAAELNAMTTYLSAIEPSYMGGQVKDKVVALDNAVKEYIATVNSALRQAAGEAQKTQLKTIRTTINGWLGDGGLFALLEKECENAKGNDDKKDTADKIKDKLKIYRTDLNTLLQQIAAALGE